MADRTPAPWNIERWVNGRPEELLGSCWQLDVAYGAFERAVLARRGHRVMMLHGAHVIADSMRPEDWPTCVRISVLSKLEASADGG